MRARGRLIAFEGGEGCGKSTQARLLADALGAVLTFEPGATDVGRRIRGVVLDPEMRAMSERAEALLMAADRAQHVDELIEPALAAGTDVVTDRYVGSSLAYQGHGRGLDVGELRVLSRWATRGLDADVVVLLEVPWEVARLRLDPRPDRMESEADSFHQRVAAGFAALAGEDPQRWVRVDGTGDVETVARRVSDAVAARLES